MQTQTPHPTSDLDRDNYSWGTGKLKFFDINPPVEEIVLDEPNVKKSFNSLPIVPYSGGDDVTSHKLVSVLYGFKDMSTTYGGILNDLKSYALGRKVQIQKIEDNIFDIADEQKISDVEQRKFNDFLKKNFIFHKCNVLTLSAWMHDSMDSTGQVGVELIRKTILGRTTVTFKFHEPMNYVFMYGNRMGDEVAISLKWDYDYLKKYPAIIVPLYPNWDKYNDGYERTFFFRSQGAKLYGRPNDLSCLPDKYNEWKLKQYLTKKNKKLWLPDVFIETQDPKGGFGNDESARERGWKNSKQRLEANFTNAGENASSFVVTNRAPETDPTFIHEFTGLKNTKEYMNMRTMFQEAICEANSWPASLLRMQGTTGLSNNIFLDLFSIKEVTKISETQMNVEEMTNSLLRIGFESMQAETEYGIKFVSPLAELVKEYKERLLKKNGDSNSEGSNSELPGGKGDTQQA